MENIKINGKYGAKVGNLQVFTRDGAIRAYKIFVRLCFKNFTMESSCVLSAVEDDMKRIGFSGAELEDIEIEALKEEATV